ncbi:MAG: hypothetical protein JKY42_12395, partial [Flavobacteriales bacterium]|nr:hypothetical protein [Flavobacteriales bacterium]
MKQILTFLVCLFFVMPEVGAQDSADRRPMSEEVIRQRNKIEKHRDAGWKYENIDSYKGASTPFKGLQTIHHLDEPIGGLNRSGHDVCGGAIAVTVDGVCLTGQTTSGFAAEEAALVCATLQHSVWYSFTLTGTNNYVDITFQNETMGGDVELFLTEQACGSITQGWVQCGDPALTFTFGTGGYPPLTPGATYLLEISNATGDEGAFDICITENEMPGASLTNQPEQDCAGAINLCVSSTNEINSYGGIGTTQEISSTCLASNETNSVWYTFTVQDISGGTTLGLDLDIPATDLYDFALYDITTIGCAGVPTATPVRCNWATVNGPKALSAPSAVSTTLPALSEGTMGSAIMPGLSDVYVGQTFALIIDNWYGYDNGYGFDFTGTAAIYDQTAPSFSSVSDCGTTKIYITMSENILCSSIAQGEFQLSLTDGGGANHTSDITAASGVSCGTTTNIIEITYTAGSLPTGNYEIKALLGNLEDGCGNKIAQFGTITFQHLAAIDITPSVNDICDAGDPVTLTATGGAAGVTYAWAPGIAGTTSSEVDNPLVTTNYSLSVTFGSCTKTATETITLVDNVVTTIDPTNPTICSGQLPLSVSSMINGAACTGCTYVWSDTQIGTPTTALSPGTYTVTVTTSGGCAGDNVPSSTIALASAGAGATCDVIYVSVAGGGDGITKSTPTDIVTALTNAQCTNTTIKCAIGTYTHDVFLDLKSYVTLEGGYNAGYTTKTSDMTSGSCTRFVRSATTADGGAGTVYSMFKINGGEDDWRIQNIRIEMPTTHAALSLKENRAINIGIGCAGYKVSGCYLDAGTGASGVAAGPRNTVMWSTGFEGGDSPCTYYLNAGGNCSNAATNVRTGTNAGRSQGTGGGGGSAGAHTGVICTEQISFISGDDYQVDVYGDIFKCGPQFMTIAKAATASYAAINGATGGDIIKANASVGSTYTLYTGTWTPGANENYYVGFDLSFSGGGGCQSAATYLDDIVITDQTIDPATAGGENYGIYAPDAIDETNDIKDCEITYTGGVETVDQLVSENGVDAGYTSVLVSGFPVIEMTNVSCAEVPIQFEATADATPGWSPAGTSAANTITDFGTGAELPGGNGGSVDSSTAGIGDFVQYASGSTGRKSINFTGDKISCNAMTWSSGAIASPLDDITESLCEGHDIITIPAQSCTWDPSLITITTDISCTDCGCFAIRIFTPDFGSGTDELSLIWGNGDPTWDDPNCTWHDGGTYTTWNSGGSSNTSSFKPQGDGNAWCTTTPDEATFGALNGGVAMNMGGNWEISVERGACANFA